MFPLSGKWQGCLRYSIFSFLQDFQKCINKLLDNVENWDLAADKFRHKWLHNITFSAATPPFPSWASWVSNALAFSQDSLVNWSWPASLMTGHCGPHAGVKYFKCDLRV